MTFFLPEGHTRREYTENYVKLINNNMNLTGGVEMTSVMWFRRDLRLEDNTALKHAFEESDQLILLFHVNPVVNLF